MEKTAHKSRIFELVDKLKKGEMSLDGLVNQLENGSVPLYEGNPLKDVYKRENGESFTPSVVHTDEASAVLGVLYDDIVSLFDELVPGSAQERADFLAKLGHPFETALGDYDDELARKASPELARRLDKFNDSFEDIEDVIRYFLGYRDLLRDEVGRRKRERKAATKKPILKPLTTPDGFLRAAADPINSHMFEALTPGAMTKSGEKERETNKLEARGMTGLSDYTSVYIVESDRKDIFGVIGYKKDVGEALWEFQEKHGALALQVHIALFARAYAETDAKPGEFITLRISDFCDDLQFTRKKGSHDRETKQRVLGILECLTQAQMKIMYTPPQGKSHLFAGAIWQRGITHETAEQTAKRLQWQPETFSYAPGQYFTFNDWRYYTRNVAKIGEGLLELDSRKDKWAIHTGGYLALLSRMNKYRKQKLTAKTLLEKSGLLATYEKHRQTDKMESKLERALDRLGDVGVIDNWDWTKTELDADGGAMQSKLTSHNLFNRLIEIEYPKALERNEKQLTEGGMKHLKNAERKSGDKTTH
jgi:hypothetical protein